MDLHIVAGQQAQQTSIYILARGPDLTLLAAQLLGKRLAERGYTLTNSLDAARVVCVSDSLSDQVLHHIGNEKTFVSVQWARLILTIKKPFDQLPSPLDVKWRRIIANPDKPKQLAFKHRDRGTSTLPADFPEAFRNHADALAELCQIQREEELAAIARIPLKYRRKALALMSLPPVY